MTFFEWFLLGFAVLANQAMWFGMLREAEREAEWLRKSRDRCEEELTKVRWGVVA